MSAAPPTATPTGSPALTTLPPHAAHRVERRHGPGLWPVRPLDLVRGEGARLYDSRGRSYLDLSAGHGVNVLGHGHPALLAALAEQSARLWTGGPAWGNDQRAAYTLELLGRLGPEFDRLFLCNSGTEAVEAALRFAHRTTGRSGVVALRRGFHGRTTGALAATWDPRHRDGAGPLPANVRHVTPGDQDELDAALTDDTAALLLEPVQGEGGVHVLDPAYLRAARELCDARGVLLVVDEVQTGFGRTGRWFAHQAADLRPDLVCLAKAMAGGLPMGGVALGTGVPELPTGGHGSTFGGNPLACAVARAVLRALEEEQLVERTRRLGTWLRGELEGLPAERVREVRGAGLMLAVELRARVAPVLAALLERGVIALAAGPTVLRLLPPLTVPHADLEEFLEHLREVLA